MSLDDLILTIENEKENCSKKYITETEYGFNSDFYLGQVFAYTNILDLLQKSKDETQKEKKSILPCSCDNNSIPVLMKTNLGTYLCICKKCGNRTAKYETKRKAVESWNREISYTLETLKEE